MVGMKNTIIWATIAIAGILIYIWPLFTTRHMYEGFAKQKQMEASDISSADMTKMMEKMQEIMKKNGIDV